MVVMTSVHAPSWHEDVHACTLTFFVPYPLHKFRLKSSCSYLWLWYLSVHMSCHILSADYVRVQLVYLFYFSFRLHAVETLFCTIFLCLHVVSCPVSFFIHSVFNYLSSYLHVGLDFFLV